MGLRNARARRDRKFSETLSRHRAFPRGPHRRYYRTESCSPATTKYLMPNGAGRIVLGFVGFVRSWRGIDAVIQAMAQQTDAPRDRFDGGRGWAGSNGTRERPPGGYRLGTRVSFTGVVFRTKMVPSLVETFDLSRFSRRLPPTRRR